MEKKERNIKIAVFAAIAGIAALSVILFSPRVSRANFLDDIVNFLKNNSSSTAVETQTPPADISTPVSLYKPALDYEEAVIRAVDVSSKSVVSIVISKDLPVIENCPVNPFGDLPREFQDFFGGGFDFFGQCQTGTKKQEVGGGSGFIVSEDGLIVTNRHVVSDKNAEYTVLTNDGKKYDAKVLAQDSINDLAIIKITATGLSAAKLGDSDSIKLGQTAIAIGNALGEFRNTVSVGVISGLARNITASGGNGFLETIQGVIQTDAAINQGNSGGPLLNLNGEVIGINTAIVSGAQNIGFAIPINQVRRSIDSVKKTGEIKQSYLGVRYVAVTDTLAEKQNLPVKYGALVRGAEDGPGVVAGSPADKAGIMAEDIITEVNGEKLDSGKLLGAVLQKYDVEAKVTLTVLRGGKEMKISVILGERPKE